MTKVNHRDVSPILQLFRKWMRGKDFMSELRFADEQAARTQPPPDVPGGPYHKTTKIYYYCRDARKLVQPPSIISQTQITDGKAEQKPRALTPGEVFMKD